jgi:hypothetical protein
MEGLYVKQKNKGNPTILLSNQRPLPRRCYTCAHELGHHVFDHGNKLDALSDQAGHSTSKDSEELLVDSFAGALLMPVGGIQAEFVKRNWVIQKASPVQFYIICSVFGTGYQTLIVHCRANGLISEHKASALLRLTPAKIFKDLFQSGTNKSHFKIIDSYSQLSVIDLEVSNYIVLPRNTQIEGDHLEKYQETSIGIGYLATKPGIVRAATLDGNTSFFIRIQNLHYIGLAENRHLENAVD